MSKKRHEILGVRPGSIAEELEIFPGDELISVNGKVPEDIFDYQYLTENESLILCIRKADGEEWELEIEKEEEEDIGLLFEDGLMDDYQSCSNHCLFCFIDQMPPGLRPTLYFKDDDSRLSFLQGNYVTLTNMKEEDLDRICRFHLSPINISVHTTNPELRCRMLHNRFAGGILPILKKLADAGITMNGQVVLCRDMNDKEELDRTIEDLHAFYPMMQSLAVVPVGLTKFREKLYPLAAMDKESAIDTLARIERFRAHFRAETGDAFVHPSDEWYLLAEREMPPAEEYDGFMQLENGVGMIRLLHDEAMEALSQFRESGEEPAPRKVTMATGKLAGDLIRTLLAKTKETFPAIDGEVVVIRNEFFGESITVSGLITGKDLLNQLSGRDLGDEILIPENMLRSGETVFLDDVSVAELSEALSCPVRVVENDGACLIAAILGWEAPSPSEVFRPYELNDDEFFDVDD